jgi:two-component system nitrate/nitrite response regulator NarL
MRALVIDDELLVLEGLEAFLQAALPELSLDKTSKVSTALRLAGTIPYGLVLLDWRLLNDAGQPVDGSAVVRALRAQDAKVPVLVVSGDESIDWPSLVLELGLSGVVSKAASGATLLDAIQVVLRGGLFLPGRSAASQPRQVPAPRLTGANELRVRFPELTDRQAEVFQVMVRGLSDKQIARELSISETTVKTHVRAILAVMGVHRRGEAIFQASARGDGGG